MRQVAPRWLKERVLGEKEKMSKIAWNFNGNLMQKRGAGEVKVELPCHTCCKIEQFVGFEMSWRIGAKMAPLKVEHVSFFNIKGVRDMPRRRRGPIATAFRFGPKKRCKMERPKWGGGARSRIYAGKCRTPLLVHFSIPAVTIWSVQIMSQ